MSRLARALAQGALLLSLAASASVWAGQKQLVILDDDLDGFAPAQVMALQAPDVQVLGLTTVSGNAWATQATAHARRMLEITGHPEVPVAQGAIDPLVNTEAQTERWEALYGKLVWKGVWMRHWVEDNFQADPDYHGPEVVRDLKLGNPSVVKARDEPAALFLLRMVRAYPGQVTIIATGPLTNLALAQRLDPQFASLAKELVYMGGSLEPKQTRDSEAARQFAREFVNTPRREFNIRFDPEAASIVMRAPWKKVVMVPVDPSTATEVTPALLARMRAADTPIARALASRQTGFPLWDELAVAVWLDPSLITQSDELMVDTNLDRGAGYGDILSWSPPYAPGLGERRQIVVRSVDVPRFEALMARLLTRPQPRAVGAAVP
ncbi:nucleoside hydrolase [Pseudoxanthomonas winnipegensis]|uniref:nucleoside hydrolase n=1 Tax=Pseudoxanthomonas winnipegensis TaxID=2480810 RepID=UPI00103E05AA|nr:nucleoside hydrolase [Pseudoxanthomonas winnipegensis]TBV73025.1 nucleoside hydrolase [Pseudoxanthomonas winnipegensis]